MFSRTTMGYIFCTVLIVFIYNQHVDCQSCTSLPSNWLGTWRLSSTTGYIFQSGSDFINEINLQTSAVVNSYRCESFFIESSGNPGYMVRFKTTTPNVKQCIRIYQAQGKTIMSFWNGPSPAATNPTAQNDCTSTGIYTPPPDMLIRQNTAVVCNSLMALNGAYQVQYKQFSTDPTYTCANNPASTAAITGMAITLNSCFTGAVTTELPLRGTTLTCAGEAANGEFIGGKVTEPGIVLLSYDAGNGNIVYYCGRIISLNLEVDISIDVTSRSNGAINCIASQTYLTATDPANTANKYIALKFTASDCAQGKCLNGASCKQELGAFTCTCVPGYTGAQCETNINECAPSPCQNGGTCVDLVNAFRCDCGTTGELSGTLCEVRNPCFSNPCQNSGGCTRIDNTAYSCACPAKYTGQNCETELFCVPDPCKNGATCQEVNPGNGFTCACPRGFSGTTCETKLFCVLENNCQNGAQCTEGQNSAICNCPNGFTGLNCETELYCVTSNNCKNGATCTEGSGKANCVCVPGTTGSNCETQLYCQPISPCQNGATCKEGTGKADCTCTNAFTGLTCGTELKCVTSNPCKNGATCQEGTPNPTCVCAKGFTGVNCESTLFCDPNLCRNGATCEEAPRRCRCGPGWSGSLCDLKLACLPQNPCLNGGTCNENNGIATCACPAGYTGALCETALSQCDSSPCKNGGVCEGDFSAFTCKCTAQWKGKTCEQENKECTARPCQNGGTCNTGTKTCTCPTGFTGQLCESVCTPSTCTTTTSTTTSSSTTTSTSSGPTTTKSVTTLPPGGTTTPQGGTTTNGGGTPSTAPTSAGFDWIPVIATVATFGGLILIGAFIWIMCCCARSGGDEKVQSYPQSGPIITPAPLMAPAIITAAPQPMFSQAPTIITAPSTASPIIEEPTVSTINPSVIIGVPATSGNGVAPPPPKIKLVKRMRVPKGQSRPNSIMKPPSANRAQSEVIVPRSEPIYYGGGTSRGPESVRYSGVLTNRPINSSIRNIPVSGNFIDSEIYPDL